MAGSYVRVKISLDENGKCDILRLQNFTKQKGLHKQMVPRLMDVLQGKEDNYILPFFWQHGESKELLEEGMQRIYDSGIKAVCVESRPHPDFVGVGWWRDLDIIMAKAKELNMRVWVLDDAHFPSGFCNGKIHRRFCG